MLVLVLICELIIFECLVEELQARLCQYPDPSNKTGYATSCVGTAREARDVNLIAIIVIVADEAIGSTDVRYQPSSIDILRSFLRDSQFCVGAKASLVKNNLFKAVLCILQ